MINAIKIWQPRYCTKSVLVDKLKVKDGKNYLYFCCDSTYVNLYSFDGTLIKDKCPLQSNGKIFCYCIPLSMLNNESELPDYLKKEVENERAKYEAYKKGKRK